MASLQVLSVAAGVEGFSTNCFVMSGLRQTTGRVPGLGAMTCRPPRTIVAASGPTNGLPSWPCPSVRLSDTGAFWGPLVSE